MKLFLSHSSRQKLLVREIRRRIPDFIDVWIDEKDILIGDQVVETIFSGINVGSDYVVLVLDNYAAQSNWVKREIEWALDKEREASRPILLPVVVDPEAIDINPEYELGKRRYISCHDLSEAGIASATDNLIRELFAIEVRGQRAQQPPATKSDELDAAERTIGRYARAFREEIYPYRRRNPISLTDLRSAVKERHGLSFESTSEVIEVLNRLKHSHMLQGCYFDGELAFLASERVSQKQDLNLEAKKQIARKAARYVESGMTIALDSGTTTFELANELCNYLEARLLHGLLVLTTSIPIAARLMSCLNEIEVGDKDSTCRVYLFGGLCRPISIATQQIDCEGQLKSFLSQERSVTVDVSFLGANGVYKDVGLANDSAALIETKELLFNISDRCFGLLEARKLAIEQRSLFAPYCDKMTIVTSGDLNGVDLDSIIKRGAKVETC